LLNEQTFMNYSYVLIRSKEIILITHVYKFQRNFLSIQTQNF